MVVAKRGRHKVFMGMAPGVGKTYQMLEEGHEEKDRGRDVVIGLLESHGREDTLSEAAGLEIVPRRRLQYRGAWFEELDLPAILRRRPELCLVDELAHTNVPGCEHAQRYQDVDAVLAAGIDVYSTVNVQHVRSLASQISGLTGLPVGETLPDHVIDGADDVVLVDITPALLIERLQAGKIYPEESVAVAERGFFRPDNLAALREISLREVAQEVEPRRKQRQQSVASTTVPSSQIVLPANRAAPSDQRVLALATPDPRMRATVYHAFRSAERLHVAFDVLWVQAEDSQAADGDDGLAALRRLVSTLGGNLIVRQGGDIVEVAARVARERHSTYLVIGQPRRRTPLGTIAHRKLPSRLMEELPGIDLQIVALSPAPE
jgi:two-component system sensor histidine kinase KdpD